MPELWLPRQNFDAPNSKQHRAHRALPRGTEPNHYHIIYTNLTEGTQLIRYKVAYKKQRDAYTELKRLGDAAEPNTEWGDDGRIRFETAMHERPGLFFFEAEVAGCIRRACNPDCVAGNDLVARAGVLVLE